MPKNLVASDCQVGDIISFLHPIYGKFHWQVWIVFPSGVRIVKVGLSPETEESGDWLPLTYKALEERKARYEYRRGEAK